MLIVNKRDQTVYSVFLVRRPRRKTVVREREHHLECFMICSYSYVGGKAGCMRGDMLFFFSSYIRR